MTQGEPVSSTSGRFHAVRFYEDDKALFRIVAEFLGDGLAAGRPAIVIATPSHRAGVARELTARSLDVERLRLAGDLLLLDATKTLATFTFMVNDKPDSERFRSSMCGAIEEVCRGRENCTVRVSGQMVDLLWKDGEPEAAIRLEVLRNQLANSHALSLLCGYAMGHFYKDANLDDICREHGEAAAVARADTQLMLEPVVVGELLT